MLLLLQPDEQYDTVNGPCWRIEQTKPHRNYDYSDVVSPLRYDAGESKATAFDIYGHPKNANRCLVPGDYPIQNGYDVTDDGYSGEAKWEYPWGFTITVEES